MARNQIYNNELVHIRPADINSLFHIFSRAASSAFIAIFSLLLVACGGGGGGGESETPPNTTDTQAPSIPEQPVTVALDQTRISISWNATSDNLAVTSYKLYRDGAFIKQITSISTEDSGLTTGQEYCYTVTAQDAAGNESAASNQSCATPLNIWAQRVYTPSISFSGLTSTGSGFLAVGNENYTFTSTNALQWEFQHDPANPQLNLIDAVWTGNAYFGISSFGGFYKSLDGISWSSTGHTSPANDLNSIAWSGDLAVAVGDFGAIYSSTDGFTWNSHTSTGYNVHFKRIEWLNNRFIAVGTEGTVLFSTDGTTWIPTVTGILATANTVRDISWNGLSYVAITFDSVYHSADALNWSSTLWSTNQQDIVWSPALNLFVAVGSNGEISTSPDAIVWTEQENSSRLPGLYRVIWDNTQFIAAGNSSAIVTSPDGVNWTSRNHSLSLEGISWINNNFYAVGGFGQIMSSADGLQWSYHSTGNDQTYHYDIAGNNNRVALAGRAYDVVNNTIDWSSLTTNLNNNGSRSIIWDGTRFVSASDTGGIYVSDEGGNSYSYITPAITGTSNFLTDIIYSGSLYVATGFGGTIITSSDLNTFNTALSGTSTNFKSIAWNGSIYVVVGDSGNIYTSTDAVNWSAASSVTNNLLSDVIWANDEFIAVGNNGSILSSTNGLDWTLTSTSFGSLKSVAYTGSRLVVVGTNSRIISIEKP